MAPSKKIYIDTECISRQPVSVIRQVECVLGSSRSVLGAYM